MSTKSFILVCLSLVSNTAFSQLKVFTNGKSIFGPSTAASSLSTISVNCSGRSDSELTVKGVEQAIYAYREGEASNWGVAIKNISPVGTANFSVGVRSEAYSETPFPSYRSFGLMGIAGNATSGWNYGVFGRLKGTQNGAGVYGTVADAENGVNTGGQYAGYFNGATKVVGDLTVTGRINGIVLSAAAPASNMANTYSAASSSLEEDNGVSDKIGCLNMVPYYIPQGQTMRTASAESSDTIEAVVPMSDIEKQKLEKVHYGLSAEQLKVVFPDLVYENEDGTSAINYMELIPVLVQTINELNSRISVLEGNANGSLANRRSSNKATSSSNAMNVDNTTSTIDLKIGADAGNAEVIVYDMNGIAVKKLNTENHGNVSFNLLDEGLKPGCYICTMTVDGRTVSTKRIAIDK